MGEIFFAQIHFRTETLTICFSLCSLQSPSFQVLGVNSSYHRELSHHSPLHLPPCRRRRQILVACAPFRFLLFDECRKYLQAGSFQG